ncbi:MAG: cytosine deaminase [Solibacillus sp.]
MQVNILQIEQLLQKKKETVRRATDKDILLIKNELLLLLNVTKDAEEGAEIRRLINEIPYLRVTVERDDAEEFLYFYEPPFRKTKRVTITESGWIKVIK